MSHSGPIARSTRQDSLASIAQTQPSEGSGSGGGLLQPTTRVSDSARSRPSSPVNVSPSIHFDSNPIRPSPSLSSSHSSSNSGFQVISRPKFYTPPSPNVPTASLPPTGAHQPSVSRHSSLTKSVGSSNGSSQPQPRTGTSPGPHRVASGSSSHGRGTRSNSPPEGGPYEPPTTLTLSSSIDSQGRRMVNQYVRLKTIGQGSHGKVWLCAQPSIRRREQREGDEAEGSSPELGRKRSNGKAAAEGLNWDDEEFDESSFEYCAIKSVARDGPGRGKSLRLAKGRKAAGSQVGIGADDKVKREVAIMKRLDHQNVVRLKEVIDDVKSKKVFMVLEFMAGGQIVWQDHHKRPTMTVDEARRTFRDVVLGLEYLHYQGIIHRDIKPANLLWNEDRSIVKISDFGVSHVSDALLRASPGEEDDECEDDKALRKTAGSPAFFAPELCHPAEYTPTPTHGPHGDETTYFPLSAKSSRHSQEVPEDSHPAAMSNGFPLSSTMISCPLPAPDPSKPRTRPPVGRGIDVWALGVTLYCLLFGDSPFMAATEYELYNVIVKEGVIVPTKMGREGAWTGHGPGWEGAGDGVEGREVVDLLSRLLEKDPAKRVTLPEVKHHPWVLRNLDASADAWLHSTDPSQGDVVKVTDADVQHATQERGLTDELPQIRNRPGIRRALNAALVKFPAFRRKQPLVDGMGPRTRTASSTDDGPSWLSRTGSDRKPPASPDVGGAEFRRTVTAESGTNGNVNGNYTPGNRGGWGNRPRKLSEAPPSPLPPAFQDLTRVPSTSSTVGGAISRLLPSRHPSSSAASRESRSTSAGTSSTHTPQTVSSPKLGNSPLPLSPAPAEGEQRRSLGRMLSRFGGRRSRASSQQSPETDQDQEFEAAEPLVLDDANSLAPSVLDARFDAFGRVISHPPPAGPTRRSSRANDDDDEVVDLTEFEYSSDDDDDDEPYSEELLNGQATAKGDSLSGWHSAFAGAPNDLINGDVLVSPATDLSEEDSIPNKAGANSPPTFALHNSSPPTSTAERLSSRALELDLGETESHALHNAFSLHEPASNPPPLVSHSSSKVVPSRVSAVEPLPAWAYEATWGYPHADRDGYVAPTSPLAPKPNNGSKFDAFADADETDEEEREVFIAPRRKRAATIERSNAHTPVTPNL